MADRLPFGGGGNTTPNKPKRMLYQQDSWTLPACKADISELEYDLRVGRINDEEFKAGKTRFQLDEEAREVAALAPAKRTAVVSHPRTR